MQERAAAPTLSLKEGGSAGQREGSFENDIVAWEFSPAVVLQSDIVGFTALGSKISAQELCGCARLQFVVYLYFFSGLPVPPPRRAELSCD